jgi:hypothetical protein
MTDEHKSALAVGRAQGIAVRSYLEGLEISKPRRGRRTSQETMRKQLAEIETKLAPADPLQRLHLLQQKRDVETRLRAPEGGNDLTELEALFVKVAADYGSRKGISYATWRESDVPAEVLKRAGISRSS